MAIELKTIDIILATASVVIFIIVFFFVFQFRRMNKATRDQKRELKMSVVAMPVEMIIENIRDTPYEQIKMPETADLKLEEILPEQALSCKPEIVETQVPEIQPEFHNEFSEKPDYFKSSEHENLTNENVELKLEEEFPEKYEDVKISELNSEISESSDLKFEDTLPEKDSGIEHSVLRTEISENADLKLEDQLPEKLSIPAQIADVSDALTANSGESIREYNSAIDIPKTPKPRKKSTSRKKTGDIKEKDKPKPDKKAVKKKRPAKIVDGIPKKIEKKKSTRKSTKPKKMDGTS